MQVVAEMRSGFPHESAISDTDMPAMVRLVKDAIKRELADKRIAIAIDGGSSMLVDGAKVVAQVAIGPDLPFDMLLELDTLLEHETAALQAAALERTVTAYSLAKDQVPFIVADNASVNGATVAMLNSKYGWNAEYVRCLPHCLNLVLVAFLSPFDDRFHMSTHLKQVRAFVKAGGGAKRRAALIEYGMSLSSIYFSDTRWEGFVSAVLYMTTMQDDGELKKAEERLRLLSKAGDATATEALEDPGKKQSHWCALYEVVESIVEKIDTTEGSFKRVTCVDAAL